MMGMKQPQKELFSYQVDLDRRVRSDHPLRKIGQAIDFTFVREVTPNRHYNFVGAFVGAFGQAVSGCFALSLRMG